MDVRQRTRRKQVTPYNKDARDDYLTQGIQRVFVSSASEP